MPATIAHVLDTTTDGSGNPITTSRETTLSAQIITTKVLSTIVGTQPSSFQTTLVDETITIPAATTFIPETTTDASGKLITTSRETTLSAHTITTKVVSTLPNDDQHTDATDTNTDTSPTIAVALGPDGTQRRLGLGSTSGAADGQRPTALVKVVLSTLAYATVLPTTIPTVLPSPPDGGPGGPGAVELEVLGLTTAQYFAGAFLPTVLAVVATSLLEVIGTNAKLMQPFQALASASSSAGGSSFSSGGPIQGGGGGAAAEASVFLRFDAYMGLLTIPQAIRLGQPLIVVTQLVVLGSAFFAPLAAEAVAIFTPSGCTEMCYGKIAVQRSVARALEGLVGSIAILLVAVLALTSLKRWKTGVNHNPWSIAGMASLCLNREVRELISRIPRGEGRAVTEKNIVKVLEGRRYRLDEFVEPTRHGVSYGLVVMEEDGQAGQQRSLLETETLEGYNEGEANRQQPTERSGVGSPGFSSWQAPLSWWFRSLLIFCVASVMAIVAYYQDSTGDSGFERFMDSRGFGVRFFSTLLGVLLGGLMGALFECE